MDPHQSWINNHSWLGRPRSLPDVELRLLLSVWRGRIDLLHQCGVSRPGYRAQMSDRRRVGVPL